MSSPSSAMTRRNCRVDAPRAEARASAGRAEWLIRKSQALQKRLRDQADWWREFEAKKVHRRRQV